MAASLNARITQVVDGLEIFKHSWTPILYRHIEQVKHICTELILNEEPDIELTRTAQIIIEQYITKLISLMTDMAQEHRRMHQILSKAGKDIERYFVDDLSGLIKADKNIDCDLQLHAKVNGIISNHFISTGKFDVADIFIKEAKITPRQSKDFRIDDVRYIMDSFRSKNVGPALTWLQENAPNEEKLIFDVQKQHFVKLLTDGSTMEALHYCRQLSGHPEDLKSMMWALVVKEREKRYPELFNPAVWLQLELRIARVLSRSEDHLSQILELGMRMVPPLITLRKLMVNRSNELFYCDELPIEAQCTELNPPMRLTCGHVVSRDALHKLAQSGRFGPPTHLSSSNTFTAHVRLKCPYCPIESSVSDAKRLYF